MSAIFGIIDFEGRPLDPAWIKSMQADLAHRGPDGHGLYEEQGVALGHMLLQVTPESVYDKSPYEEDGYVITANARLDERETIMDRLNVPKEERDKITDPLLLLRSFKKFGKNFVKDIYGDFAFAIWDKNKKELFCARDQIGVKPILYHLVNNLFVLSTELKAIVKLPFVSKELDMNYLQDRAFDIRLDLSRTYWKHIFRLKSANYLIIQKSNIYSEKYWIPRYTPNYQFKIDQLCFSKTRQILERIIADHTRVIGQVGSTLSGGLDSSTVTCLAARKLLKEGKKVITVSSIYKGVLREDDDFDDFKYIKEVIKQEHNLSSFYVTQSELNFYKNLHSIFDRHYAPVNLFYYVDEALNRIFENFNVHRVLSGHLGDITISNRGINPLPHLLLSGRFKTFVKLFKMLKSKSNDAPIHYIRINVLSPLLPVIFKRSYWQFRNNISNFIKQKLPVCLSGEELKKLSRKMISDYRKKLHDQQDISAQIWPLHIDYLEEEEDCSSSYYKIEVTYPLIDRRIIEFLLQIPVEKFTAGGIQRGLIRKAMSGIIPEKIRDRTTKGYYSPGFHGIIGRDLIKIKSIFRDDELANKLIGVADLKKIYSYIELFEKTEKFDKFDAEYLAYLKTIMSVLYIDYCLKNKFI